MISATDTPAGTRVIATSAANSTAATAALALTGRDYLSWSAIRTYMTCPLQYYFRYVERLPEPSVSSSLVFGGAIHRCLEHHYRERMAAQPPPALAELMDVYRSVWELTELDRVQFAQEDDLPKLQQVAERMLRAFQVSPLAEPEAEVAAVEEELRGPVMADCPDLLVRIDLVLQSDQGLTLVDLKTSRGRWNEEQVEVSSGQLLLYGALVGQLARSDAVDLQFYVLTKAKQPDVAAFAVASNPQRRARALHALQRVWQAIQAQLFFPTPSVMHCSSCAYRAPCRRWPGEGCQTA